ncbi:MAG: hypothetical protein ACE5FM_00970 [Methyloligellaceae bacterium]
MSNTGDLCSVLETELANSDSGWSIGSIGAIAEFHQSPGEEIVIDDPQNLTRATTRGAIRLRVCETAHPVAYEALSPRPHRWMQGIALCLPERAVRIDRVSALTYLGRDDEAIRAQDKDAHLFDMGLNLPQLRFCVRTHDQDLTDLFQAHCGQSLWERGNHSMDAILKSHPHRVAMSNLGRVEVYQMIGGPDTGGVSPQGPHTHLLPQLLRTGRTHSANTPIPTGLLPCASLYPANPVIDPLGKDRAFNPQSFKRFQEFLKAWGPHEYVQVKTAVWDAVRAGGNPATFDPPATRLGRTAMRNALRQLARITEHENDEHGAELVSRWRVLFDQQSPKERVEPDSPGH